MKSSPHSPVEFLAPLSRYPERVYATEMPTPFGPMTLAGEENALLAARLNVTLDAFSREIKAQWDSSVARDRGPFVDVIHALEEYFSGKPGPIHAVVRPLPAPPFIRAVHRALATIPYGETVTYAELAEMAGKPGAARAAGSGCGRNPVIIIVPCHRVIASKGLGGFGAGLDVKKRLLALEAGN